jgi:2,3-bisphosphoglycerate-independent phosphoglycerate mutase
MGFAGKAAVVVMDGFGLDPSVEWSVVVGTWQRLNGSQRDVVLTNAEGDEELAQASLAPTSHGVARVLARKHQREWDGEFARISAARARLEELAGESRLEEVFTSQRQDAAREANYAPWTAHTPFIYQLRQENPTWITRAAGVFAGHADLRPEIMGNSDTGHQQMFNLAVARQIPAFLSDMIESGEFFELPELNKDLRRAEDGATVVFKTLLSGEHGDDGFVHSAWPHLEAFLKLYFEILKLPAQRLQIEAVLDGRDSPGHSSMRYEERDGEFRFGFLRKLKKLLMKYNAQNSLRWIIGRQFMDRDYKGAMIRKEYEMLTQCEGRFSNCIDDAFARVEEDHAAGFTDPQVEPIIIGHPVPVGANTVFFNGIFRADRQEPITAALLGLDDFIRRQAEQKRRLDTWGGFTWLKRIEGLTMWSMIDYHEDFAEAGCKSLYKDHPHPHNVLHLLNDSGRSFHFLFLTEGVKEKHMGLFSRGRRSTPLEPAEAQHILPSYGREDDINSDNDFWKVPQMKHPEIAAELTSQLQAGAYDVVAANFPGPDMIGHLIEDHFESCVETLKSLDKALKPVVAAARESGYTLILLADHGNVEHFGPDHGNNDVLTTVLLPDGSELSPQAPPDNEARLFDVARTVLTVLGTDPEELNCPPIDENLIDSEKRLVGVSLVVR